MIRREEVGVSMKMNFNLNLVQSQKLVMTPELKQAIEILQFNSVELNDFIQDEMLSNPVLKSENQPNTHGDEPPVQPIENQKTLDAKEIFDKIDWKDTTDEYRNERYSRYQGGDDEIMNYDNFVASEDTLIDHLLSQLELSSLQGFDKEIAAFLIQMIDDNGYIDVHIEEVSERFKMPLEKVEDILFVLQGFEPLGVCARDLRECLLIQLSVGIYSDPIAREIVNHYLDDLGRNKLSKIAKELSVDIETVKGAIETIRSLEPKPGRMFASLRSVRYITPDVFIRKIENEYVVVVNDSTAPRLRISNFYKKMLTANDVNKNAVEYINKKLVDALKLIKSIEQRRNTIYRVVNAILKAQYDFFEKGPVYLKTLTLKDIADEVGVHESTVSRAVNGKYLQCPRGLYEIKYFFQSGVSSVYGDGVSAESIKSIIRDLIDNENPKKPLSDQYISDELNKLGIKISRRTVAKYRDELGILSTSKRKTY